MPLQRLNCLRSCLPNVLGVTKKEKKSCAAPLVVNTNAHIGADNAALPHRSSDCLIESRLSASTSPVEGHPEDTTDGVINLASLSATSTPNAVEAEEFFSVGLSGTESIPQPVPLQDHHDVIPAEADDPLLDDSQEDYIPLDQCHSGRSHQRQSTTSSTSSSSSPQYQGFNVFRQTPGGSRPNPVSAGSSDTLPSERPMRSSRGPDQSTTVYSSISSYSNDSFLLDAVPPSPCRGQVQLKPAPGVDYGTRHNCHVVTSGPQQVDHGSNGMPHYSDSSRSPPPVPPSSRSRTAPDYSRVVLVDRSPTQVEPSLYPAPMFQAPPPVQRRTIYASSVSKIGHSADEAIRVTSPSPYSGHRRVGSQWQYSGTAISADRSQPTGEENEDENIDDDSGITCPQTPAPSVPDRRYGAQSIANGYRRMPSVEQASNRQPRQSVDKRPSQSSVDSSSIPDSSQYVESDRMPISPRRPATAAPRSDICQNYSSSASASASSKITSASSESARSVTDQLSLSSNSLHHLHSSPPAPHLTSVNQMRHHRYINAAAVSFDPNRKGDSRFAMSPMPISSNMADYRAVQSRGSSQPYNAVRTLPASIDRTTTPPGDQGRYYNTDVPSHTLQSSLDRRNFRGLAADSYHNSSFDSSYHDRALSYTHSIEVPLPTKKRCPFDDQVSSTDEEDMLSGQSGYSSADSSLDRHVAPPTRLQYQSDEVNYAVLALLDDSSSTSVPPSSAREQYVSGRLFDSTTALQRQIPRAMMNGAVPSPSLSSQMSTMTPMISDADDKSTVYNVIDWEKTQVLNEMRKQLETNRHLSTNCSASNSLGQKIC